MKTDRYFFEKLIQIADGRNIQLGRNTGTRFGTSTLEKIGFYGHTPIEQQAISQFSLLAATDPNAATNFTRIKNVWDELYFGLLDIGLFQ